MLSLLLSPTPPRQRANSPARSQSRVASFLTRCAVVSIGILFSAQIALAQNPVTILFVGNSFTYGAIATAQNYNSDKVTDENGSGYGGVPGIFKQFTLQRGLNYDVHIEAVSGQSLQYHFENKAAIIGQSKWDTVVLQGLSTEATIQAGNRPNFILHAQRLENLIHNSNAAAKIYLYETWSRADRTYPPNGEYFGEPVEAMGNEIHDGYFEAFNSTPNIVAVVRTGDAWLRAIVQGFAVRNPYNPVEVASGKYNLWASDSYHASNYGYYLSALMMFGKITGEDPRVLGAGEQAAAALNITPVQAVNLQNLAYAQLNAPAPGVVVSRKTHGSAGTFDLPLALSGPPTVECRRADANGGFQLVFTFEPTLTTAGTVSVTGGTATAASLLGPEPNQITVNLTGVPNAQRLFVSVSNVDDGSTATPLTSMSAPLSVLVGDSNGDGMVNSSDVSQTKSRSGQPLGTAAAFRSDFNVDGAVNASDVSLVKSTTGTSLPSDL